MILVRLFDARSRLIAVWAIRQRVLRPWDLEQLRHPWFCQRAARVEMETV